MRSEAERPVSAPNAEAKPSPARANAKIPAAVFINKVPRPNCLTRIIDLKFIWPVAVTPYLNAAQRHANLFHPRLFQDDGAEDFVGLFLVGGEVGDAAEEIAGARPEIGAFLRLAYDAGQL